MIPAAGQKVGPYEILGRLGSGGMGLVFSAWDSRLHRDVAIKILRDEYVREDSRERFLQEARAASGLNHPNICTVFDIGEQNGDPYLVMELLKGETLRGRIFSGPMPPEEILQVGIDVADALVAAHARGIIHRDIKPANIFLVAKSTGGWQAKVLDFGLAKMSTGDGFESSLHMTGVGSTVGTVSYMSPEQARGETLDARSDLFGVGILLYEMATGRVPFRGTTSALVFVQLLGHAPEPLRELNPNIPKDLERIIFKLLAKDRSARFQSSAELLEALRGVNLDKQAPVRSRWFSRPSRPAVHEVVEPPQPSPSPRPASRAPESGSRPGVRESSAGERRPSSEVIRPVRREPLPPVTLAPAVTHWTQPPLTHALAATPAATVVPEPSANPVSSTATKIPSTESHVPAIFAYEVEDDEVAAPAPEFVQPHRSHGLLWILAAVAALIVAGIIAWRIGRSSPEAAGPATLMLVQIANHSGDKTLDGIVLEGLRFDLAQSPRLTVMDNGTATADLASAESLSFSDAQHAASAAGATSYLLGEIRSGPGSTIVSIGIYNAGSGAVIVQAEETAGSREQIADAIDRLSSQIRIGLGEPGDEVTRTSVSLARDATANVEALEAYATAAAAESNGHLLDAIAAFQHAVSLEPRFTQAWLRLAGIYRGMRAEVAAAGAATHARDAAGNASDRTKLLAQASYELNATGDYLHALALLDQLAASYPLDLSIQADRALLLRLQGKFPEAIGAAETSLARNPNDLEASGQEELAMLALNRVEAAAQLESQVERRGQGHPGLGILLPFLEDSHGATSVSTPGAAPEPLLAMPYRARVLDATGQLNGGLEDWRATANAANQNPALVSAASFALAQAALDRALTADCVAATALAREASALSMGESALFAVGMTQGLCGDLDGVRGAEAALTAQYPQSFRVKNYYLANLKAIDQIRSGDPNAALTTLQSAKQCDLLSLTAYLRGLAHGAAGQWPTAIADFQFILLHRGAAMLTSAPMYAMSQLGLARAYAASGDDGNSATAYKSFLDMWQAADSGNPLVAEAREHLK
jgi:eukaryotic-like serine/threonine-protein kinase